MSQISLNGYSKHAFDKRLKQSFKNKVAQDANQRKLSDQENFISQLHNNTKLYPLLNTSPDKSWWDIGRETPYYRQFNKKKINDILSDIAGNADIAGNDSPHAQLKTLKKAEDADNLKSGIAASISAGVGASATAIGMASSHASIATALAAGKAATFAIAGTALFNPLTLIPLGLGVGGAMLIRKLWPKRDEEANALTKKLQDGMNGRMTNQHQYWQEASSLDAYDSTNIPEAIKTVINLYKFGDDAMKEKNGHSLLDTFIDDDTKGKLSGFTKIDDDNKYQALKLDTSMSKIPEAFDTIMKWENMEPLCNEASNALLPITNTITNAGVINDIIYDNRGDEIDRVKRLLGLRMLVMKEMGITPEFSQDEQKVLQDTFNSNASLGFKKAIEIFDKKYKQNYNDAVLLFQAKNSMAAPVFTKIRELLDKQIEKLSVEVSDRNIENVPEFMEKVTKKYIQKLMVQLGLQSDLKMARTLEALRNTSMQKMAGVLNNFSSDSNSSEFRKLSYKNASLDNLYPAVASYEKKLKTASNQISQEAIRKIIDGKISQAGKFKDRLILNSDKNFGQVRRWKHIPFFKRPLNPNAPAERDLHNLINNKFNSI